MQENIEYSMAMVRLDPDALQSQINLSVFSHCYHIRILIFNLWSGTLVGR